MLPGRQVANPECGGGDAQDAQAFAGIVARYERRLRAYCRSRLPASEVDDAVQDVFVKAFRGLAGFKLGYSFAPWLFAIARSAIAGRKHRFRNEEDKRARLSADYDPGAGVNDGEAELEAESLRRAVSSLPRGYRDAVELYYFAELDTEKTAAALGIGVEAVKTRLFRARKLLHEMLGGGNPGLPRGV